MMTDVPEHFPHGRVAVVTGAASGIGAATMLLLCRLGWTVLGVDLDEAGLRRQVAQVDGRAVAFPADVASDSDCATVVAAARAEGRLEAICNIAGIAPYNTSVVDVTPEVWAQVLAVNLTSVYLMSRHAAPVLRDSGGGSIVNTASVHAYASQAGCAPYAASKGAVVALTRQMAIDLTAWGIRVNAVAPGSVDTPMSRSAAELLGRSLNDLGFVDDPRVVGRIAVPGEVASAYAWLISSQASFVNGTTMVVDGGLLAPMAAGQVPK